MNHLLCVRRCGLAPVRGGVVQTGQVRLHGLKVPVFGNARGGPPVADAGLEYFQYRRRALGLEGAPVVWAFDPRALTVADLDVLAGLIVWPEVVGVCGSAGFGEADMRSARVKLAMPRRGPVTGGPPVAYANPPGAGGNEVTVWGRLAEGGWFFERPTEGLRAAYGDKWAKCWVVPSPTHLYGSFTRVASEVLRMAPRRNSAVVGLNVDVLDPADDETLGNFGAVVGPTLVTLEAAGRLAAAEPQPADNS